MKNVCIFCGSSSGNNPKWLNYASELSNELASKNYNLVYGGASIGLMGKLADNFLKNHINSGRFKY